jgi:hypothetical protein
MTRVSLSLVVVLLAGCPKGQGSTPPTATPGGELCGHSRDAVL